MHRRAFIQTGGSAALSFALGGCAGRAAPASRTAPAASASPPVGAVRRRVSLAPVHCTPDRVIRTVVGLRPHRDAGFVVGAARLDEKTVIHNYGHGGAGMSLSWGTASLAADLAVQHAERRAAVIGGGIIGLTSARELQRRGFDVTIYAAAISPGTTSDRSLASFTPTSGLVSVEQRTPAWNRQCGEAVRIAWAEHQRLIGPRHGVAWIDEYHLTDQIPVDPPGGPLSPFADLLPPEFETGNELLLPSQHPFPSRYATRHRTLRFAPSVYLGTLREDLLAAGGRIVLRSFEAAEELSGLAEPLVVNCAGLGARALFGDSDLVPVKGQLTLLAPQPEVDYMVWGMLPRSDGIMLNGGMQQRDDWNTEPDLAHQELVLARYRTLFDAMRPVGDAGQGP